MNLLGCIIIYLVYGVVWAVATQKILENKGYSDDMWLLWGFLFNIAAALVALSKPDIRGNNMDRATVLGNDNPLLRNEENKKITFDCNSQWLCKKCNRVNAMYVGTCACGNTKLENNSFSEASNTEDRG